MICETEQVFGALVVLGSEYNILSFRKLLRIGRQSGEKTLKGLMVRQSTTIPSLSSGESEQQKHKIVCGLFCFQTSE